jgi:hypothetical protein
MDQNISFVQKNLPNHSDLFYRALSRFRERAKTLILINLITSVITFIVVIISITGSSILVSATGINSIPSMIFIAISALAAIILMVMATAWGQVSFYTALTSIEKPNLTTSFSKGQKLIGRYLWLSLLFGLIVGFGYLLFLIPGIIFSVWFCFSFYLIVTEDVSAFDSLLISRELVKKRVLAVFGRLLFMLPFFIAPLVIGLLADYLSKTEIFSGITQLFMSFIIFPFFSAYLYELFVSLKEIKGKFVFNPDTNTRLVFTILPAIGLISLIIFPLAILAVINPSKEIEKAISTRREIDFISIQGALLRYQTMNNRFPQDLNQLIESGEIREIPENFEYKTKGKDYELCFTSNKDKTCKTSLDYPTK